MDYTRNTMRAAIKSLESVIIPAVEATAQAQAIEQARLVSDFLRFAEQRVHMIADRERHQLLHAVRLATTLEPLLDGTDVQDQLSDARARAERLLTDPQRDCESVRRQTSELDAAIRLVTEGALSGESRLAVGRAILRASLEQSTVDRAWLLPLGFDPDPEALPDIAKELSAPVPSRESAG
ncbi:hypothetical protein [Nocardiopsis oceani]